MFIYDIIYDFLIDNVFASTTLDNYEIVNDIIDKHNLLLSLRLYNNNDED